MLECTEAQAHLHILRGVRIDGTHTVVFLAEPIARDAHRLLDAAERKGPILRLVRQSRTLQPRFAQALVFGQTFCRIDVASARQAADDGEIGVLAETCACTDAHALLKRMTVRIKHILLCCLADGRILCIR